MFDQRNYESNGLFYLRWIARILSLATIILLFFFLVGEEFEVGRVGLNQWLGLLFFPVGLVVGLMMSWKNEGFGAIVSIASLLAFYLIYGLILSGRLWQGWAFLMFAIPSFLFLIYWFLLPKRIGGLRHI